MKCLITKLKDDPMARYVPNKVEVENLCEVYQVGKLKSIDGELGGLFNVNLKISTDTGQYVIRVHSGLSRETHLNAENVVQQKLLNNGIPVLTPFHTKDGTHFTKLYDRFIQLTPFVQSTPFIFSNEQVFECGNLLRKFHHSLLENIEIPTPYWSNYPSNEVLKEGIVLLKQEQKDLHKELEVIEVEQLYQKVMEQWLPKEDLLSKVIIHGDWHPWNVFFNEKNKIKYIIDFDFLQKGERIHDIAYFLWAIRNEVNKDQLGRQFLKGYGPLTSLEYEILPLAIARVSLFFICTSSFNSDPAKELQKQMNEQKPYIEWLLSNDGKRNINSLRN